MHDVVIVGGGLCGLALAHSLQARRLDWLLLEAEPTLGGRVMTVEGPEGQALDLGPTWFWPATQPQITRLIADLGLPSMPQADDGRLLCLDDAGQPPRTLSLDPGGQLVGADHPRPGAVHGGARRLAGGMATLIEALASRLPRERLRCGRTVRQLDRQGDSVSLAVDGPEGSQTLRARRVVLALPPRVAASRIGFTPALPPALRTALDATRTWMATAAKAAVAYPTPFWADRPGQGSAWSTHAQAVLAEVFDASPPADAGRGAALAGFLALGAADRQRFAASLPLLIDSQLTMLFGAEAGLADGEVRAARVHQQDWARRPGTCSALDLADDGLPGHPVYGDQPALAEGHWDGHLWFGGSETAGPGGGYLEGALTAAARLRRQLDAAIGAAPVARPSGAPAMPGLR